MDETTRRARDFWNAAHARGEGDRGDNIFAHPLLHAYVSLRAFGQLTGQIDAVVVALRERTAPGDEILVVGCGPCHKEKLVAAALADRRFVAIDIADQALAQARAAIAAAGVHNLVVEHGDFNRLDLRVGRYACILCLGTIHHVEALEAFWQQCRRGLRAGGAVIAQEYIGPSRLQWTEAQLREGSRVLRDLVPPEHQVHHHTVERIPVAHMLAVDPSEAVRSAEILPTLRASGLEVTAVVGTGCSLLQPVLMHQIQTFDPRDWQHNLVLANLFAEEDRLLAAGTLDHDFAWLVARNA
jgi:SAM-dependent methyltransferase